MRWMTRIGVCVALGIAAASLASCRGCREDEAPPRASSPDEAPAAEARDTTPKARDLSGDGGAADGAHAAGDERTGELCYLAVHYGPVPVDLATLTGDATLTCAALEPVDVEWACDWLCAVARRLGPDVRLPVSATTQQAVPGAPRALWFDTGAVRGASDQVLARLETPDDGAPPRFADARAARVVSEALVLSPDSDDPRIALAVEPEVPLRLALDALTLPRGASAVRVDLLTAPGADEVPESARVADEIAVAGRIELSATSVSPPSDALVLMIWRSGVRVAVDGPWLGEGPAAADAPALDEAGLEADLEALAQNLTLFAAGFDSMPPFERSLWLWVEDGVPMAHVVRALDVVRYETEPDGATIARDRNGQPRPRFAEEVVVQVQVPPPARLEDALPAGEQGDAPPTDDAVPVDEIDESPASFEGGEGFEPAAIHQAVGEQTAALDDCHRVHLERGGVPLDVVVLSWTIGPDGRVTAHGVEGIGDAPDLAACFGEALRAMTFTAPTDGVPVQVHYPLGFSAGE